MRYVERCNDDAGARADVMDAVFGLLATQIEVGAIPHGELAPFLDDASTTTAQAVSNLLRTLRDTQRALVALALRA